MLPFRSELVGFDFKYYMEQRFINLLNGVSMLYAVQLLKLLLFFIESSTKHKQNIIYNTVQHSVPANK